MLELVGVEAAYARAAVLQDLSFGVAEGEIVTLIGGNGAGKSTTLRAISRLIRVRRGQIRFLGAPISDRPSHEVVRLGLTHVPEGRRLFADMSVRENLLLGAYTCARRDLDARLGRVYEWFPHLRDRDGQLAGSLSGGEQQMLAIGRGLMVQPKLLMLDEPSLGLAPKLVAQVADMILEIRARGVTVLLVEQNARLALRISDRAYVLQTGRVVLEGRSADLLADPTVQRAYLGLT